MIDRLKKEHIIAKPEFNRWCVPPTFNAIHLRISSLYVWSIYNPSLSKVDGIVTSAATD